MSSIDVIRVKRERLVERIAGERRALAESFTPWRGAFAVADRGVSLARYLYSRPLLVALAATVLTVLRGRRVLGWARRGFALWRAWRFASALLGNAAARESAS